MKQITKEQMLDILGIFHKWQRLNFGKLHLNCTVMNFDGGDLGVQLELIDALNDVKPGDFGRFVYSFESYEEAMKKVEYMKQLILDYGGRVE